LLANGIEARLVKLSQVAFTAQYQRELSVARAKRIKNEFNWRYFGAPILVRKGKNKYETADGQHRIHSLHLLYPDRGGSVQKVTPWPR